LLWFIQTKSKNFILGKKEFVSEIHNQLAQHAVLERIGLKFERMIRLTEQSPELKLFGPAKI